MCCYLFLLKVIYLYFQNPDVPPPARRFRQGDGRFDAPPDWAERSQGTLLAGAVHPAPAPFPACGELGHKPVWELLKLPGGFH